MILRGNLMKITVFGDLFPDITENLKNFYDNFQWIKENKMPSEENFIDLCKDSDAILILLNFKINSNIIYKLPKLKVICNYAVGYNNIDIKACNERGIIVFNTPDVLTNATAETAIALTFAVSRNLNQAVLDIKSGNASGWGPRYLLGKDICGKTVGVIGAGRIGSCYAEKMKNLGCNVIYYNRSKKTHLDNQGILFTDLITLLEKSDIISLHTPLNEYTREMIGEEEFSRMKDGAILINTSRGDCIDENALISALNSGKLYGAGLDVYKNEPIPAEELINNPRVTLIPHIGSATIETRREMNKMCIDSLSDFASNNYKTRNNIVNREIINERN